jgi:hypothetical protein
MSTQSLLCCPECDSLPELLLEKTENGMTYTLGCEVPSCVAHAYALQLSPAEFPIDEVIQNWNDLERGGVLL